MDWVTFKAPMEAKLLWDLKCKEPKSDLLFLFVDQKQIKYTLYASWSTRSVWSLCLLSLLIWVSSPCAPSTASSPLRLNSTPSLLFLTLGTGVKENLSDKYKDKIVD